MKISVITPTHDPRWLLPAFDSLQLQTHADWEWVVVPNNFDPDTNFAKLFAELVPQITRDARVRIVECQPYIRQSSVGALKAFAFAQGTGEVLLELDHDDLLHPEALYECADVFARDQDLSFAYSEAIDFPEHEGQRVTYHEPERRAAWAQDGWKFGTAEFPSSILPKNMSTAVAMDPQVWGEQPPYMIAYPICFEPSALSVSQIYHAPNHFRAWRREFYTRIGGHNPKLEVCDDLELMQRTYLAGTMRKIPRVLYFYRVQGGNTWLRRQPEIAATSLRLREENLHKLVARECELRGLPCVDLGGAFDSPGKPWVPFDRTLPWPEGLPCRLSGSSIESRRRAEWLTDLEPGEMWPFPDSSIGAFRACDFLEHLSDKVMTMSEIYRCLAPGGWLLSFTPDALGRGAHQDPTHESYWVEQSFHYYTRKELARYIRNDTERFMAVRLHTTTGQPPYVVADLVSLKGDDGRLPGRRMI
jgi:glycosyltransferase involved in cell wall biosynthesis